MLKIKELFNKIHQKRWVLVPVLFACLILMISFSSLSFARYYKKFMGNNSANIAIMANDVVIDYNFTDINLKPGSEVSIPITLLNKKNGHVSEVKQTFVMSVETLSNIPLTITIYDAQNNIVTMPTGSFEAGVLGSYEYTIKISWDINDNNYELSQEIDIIRIFIDSTQVGGA